MLFLYMCGVFNPGFSYVIHLLLLFLISLSLNISHCNWRNTCIISCVMGGTPREQSTFLCHQLLGRPLDGGVCKGFVLHVCVMQGEEMLEMPGSSSTNELQIPGDSKLELPGCYGAPKLEMPGSSCSPRITNASLLWCTQNLKCLDAMAPPN